MENTTHVVNQRLKRIEPLSKKCGFCSNGFANNVEDCSFVPVFKTQDRTNIIVYRSVKFSKILIGVTRCPECKKVHRQSNLKALLVAIPFALLVLAFMVYNFMNFHALVSVLLTFLGIGVGCVVHVWLQKRFLQQAGVDSLHDGAMNNALIHEFLKQGWSLTQPSA
jgi:uncharacterized protein (UPF0212 family)